MGREWRLTVYFDADRLDVDTLFDNVEGLICPDPEEAGHEENCPLYAMSSGPVTQDDDVRWRERVVAKEGHA